MTMPLIDAVLAFGLVVVVPLAIRLHGEDRSHVAAAAIAGGSASLSFLLPEGLPAALLASGWILVPGFLMVRFRNWSRPWGVRGWVDALPVAYLLIGTLWLVVSRFGARPLGFTAAIVELTAMHFHYAGFVAPTILERLVHWLEGQDARLRRLSLFGYWAVLLATPVTAMGITFAPALGSLGTALFSAGLVFASVVTLREVVGRAPGRARAPLTISALSVVVAMALALSYSLGQWLHTPAPSLTLMAWTHGLLNSVGFAFGGVVGWVLVGDRGPQTYTSNGRKRSKGTDL